MYCFSHSSFVSDCGIDNAADALHEFLLALNITQATILGESWGSGVAIEFAYRYPNTTDNLILLSGMGIQEGEPFGTYVGDKTWQYFVYPFLVYYPGVFYHDISWRRGIVDSFIDSDQRPIANHLKSIKTRTLILHSKTDTVIPFWVAEKHAQLLQNSQLEEFKGTHGEFHTNVGEIAPKINNFLQNGK
jgi:pimeloyl-ACP methyl ester carboxylesterase